MSHTVRDTVKNLAFDFVKNAKHHGSPTLNYTLLPLGWLDKASKEIMDCIPHFTSVLHSWWLAPKKELLHNVLGSSTNKTSCC